MKCLLTVWPTSISSVFIFFPFLKKILTVKEIDEDLIDEPVTNKKEIVKKENKMHTTDQDYNYGDKVEHDTYGKGVVIEVTNTILTIAFDKKVGIKKILKNHKSVRRI